MGYFDCWGLLRKTHTIKDKSYVMSIKRREICEADGYRLLEVSECVDGERITRYQIMNPNFDLVGRPHSTIHQAFNIFRTFLEKGMRLLH